MSCGAAGREVPLQLVRPQQLVVGAPPLVGVVLQQRRRLGQFAAHSVSKPTVLYYPNKVVP